MKINIIATGSGGNSFVFDDTLMIDIGVSFKELKSKIDIKKITHILLTHSHGDHFNDVAIRKMSVNTDCKFVCGEWLKPKLISLGVESSRILLVYPEEVLDIGSHKISPVIAYHDVPNFGYRISDGKTLHFHITDTSTLEGITALNYDSATIECNHCEIAILDRIAEADKNGEFTHLRGAMNSHLSVQKAIKFCNENNIKNITPIHIGASTRKEVMEYINGNDKNSKL